MALQDFRRGECLDWRMFKGQSNVPIFQVDQIDPNGYQLLVTDIYKDVVAHDFSSANGAITVDVPNLAVAINMTNLEIGEYHIRFIELSQTAPFDEFYIGKLRVDDPNKMTCR